MSLLAFAPIVEKIFDRVIPDPAKAAEAKLSLLQLQQQGELAFLDSDLKAALAQASINAEEAKSPSLFKSGWRPATGWICVAGFAWAMVAQPVLVFILTATGTTVIMPSLDTGALMTMLGGLLGLGGFRTYERFKGVEKP